jgi:hypothetical protein
MKRAIAEYVACVTIVKESKQNAKDQQDFCNH